MGLRVENGQVVESNRPKLNAEFYEHAKRVAIDKWEPTIFVKLRAPPARDYISRQATEDDKLEFAEAWDLYQAGAVKDDSGTPLGQLPANKSAFELELKARGIDTVELLASLDEPPAKYMNMMWKQAKRFIELERLDDEEI